jgi:cytochrome P450
MVRSPAMSTATMARSAAAQQVHRPPLPRVLAQPLRFLETLRADGRPVVPFRLGGRTAHLVTEPELIAQVLEEATGPAARGPWYLEPLLLPRRPRLPEPPSLAEIGAERARRRAAAWVEGSPLEMVGELRALCVGIAWEALTGTDLDAAPDLLAELAPPRPWRRTRHERLDSALALMIEERRGRDAGDLLSVLVAEGGADDQIAARAWAWLTGDRTHAALVWTMWLLAQHSDAEARFHAAAGGPDALAAAERVVGEALRLYPPVWASFRTAPESLPLGDALVPKGDLVAVSPWVTQRDPRLWPDPLRFDPGRAAGPDGAFFPFADVDGDGAARHAARIMAALGGRWAYRQSEPELTPAPRWALVPAGGARLKPVPRP